MMWYESWQKDLNLFGQRFVIRHSLRLICDLIATYRAVLLLIAARHVLRVFITLLGYITVFFSILFIVTLVLSLLRVLHPFFLLSASSSFILVHFSTTVLACFSSVETSAIESKLQHNLQNDLSLWLITFWHFDLLYFTGDYRSRNINSSDKVFVLLWQCSCKATMLWCHSQDVCGSVCVFLEFNANSFFFIRNSRIYLDFIIL